MPYTSVTLCDVTSAPATESACDESTTQRLYAIDDNETDRRLRGAMQEGLLRLLRQPGGQLDLRPSIWQIRSVHSGEGRTALTLALARVWSEAGLRVLMVDGDCDRAELTARIEPSPLAGWEQIGQSESASPSGKPWYSLDERLAVLPWCGTATRAGSGDPRTAPCATREDTSVIRQGPIAAGSLVRFMDSFDRILVDTAPGQQDWDTSVPASRVRALVVRDVRRTSAEELQAFLYHLAESGLEVVGCIDNFVNHEAQDTI